MPKAYISGALSNAPESLKRYYESVGEACQEVGFEVYIPHVNGTDPVKNPEVSERDVFRIDKREVSDSDIVIAYIGAPSLGVGMELAFAHYRNIPIILMYEEDQYTSRLARGTPSIVAEIKFRDHEHALSQLRGVLEQYLAEHFDRLGNPTEVLYIVAKQPPQPADQQLIIRDGAGAVVFEGKTPAANNSYLQQALQKLDRQGYKPRIVYIEPFSRTTDAIRAVWPSTAIYYEHT